MCKLQQDPATVGRVPLLLGECVTNPFVCAHGVPEFVALLTVWVYICTPLQIKTHQPVKRFTLDDLETRLV